MQQQMSFLEMSPPPGTAPVWAALDEQQRAEVVTILARLIVQVATAARNRVHAAPVSGGTADE
jgi:hypothetical protein